MLAWRAAVLQALGRRRRLCEFVHIEQSIMHIEKTYVATPELRAYASSLLNRKSGRHWITAGIFTFVVLALLMWQSRIEGEIDLLRTFWPLLIIAAIVAALF